MNQTIKKIISNRSIQTVITALAIVAVAATVATGQGDMTRFSCAEGQNWRADAVSEREVDLSCIGDPINATATATATANPTETPLPTETATSLPPTATATATELPTATATQLPTATASPSPTATEPPSSTLVTWRSDFSGPEFNPSSPTSLFDLGAMSDWAKIIHTRDAVGALDLTRIHHGTNCDGPPATHDIFLYRDALFACRNHIMTAATDTEQGYSMAGFSPPVATFFGGDETVTISFRMSTNVSSVRDWVDINVIPQENYTPYSLQRNFAPDLTGSSVGAMMAMLTATTAPLDDNFNWEYCEMEVCADSTSGQSFFTAFDHLTFEERSRNRELFELTFSNGMVTFSSPESGIVWFGPTPMSDPEACVDGCAVLFMHHTYNATKSCLAGTLCTDTTWHWSDISIDNTAPMPMNQSVEANVWTRANETTMNWDTPSLGGETMQCAVLGTNTQYSWDGVNFQDFEQANTSRPDLADNFSWRHVMVNNVPAGIDRVFFQGRSGWGDLSVDSCVFIGESSP